jgi:LmbE family N-acetylglucosaminyl deacetylase
MRVTDLLAKLSDAPIARLSDKACGRGIVVVAPHQDDESLGCGGLIAQAVRLGLEVRIIFVSDGVGSHPNSRTYPADRLRKLRELEAVDAARRLGVGQDSLHFLRLPDRFVPDTGDIASAASKLIAAVADEIDAGLVLTTWRGDPHCDHKAAWILARDAARLAKSSPALHSYVVWGWVLDESAETGLQERPGWRLDITNERAAKAAAIAAHASQITDLIDDDPTAFRLDQAMIARFTGRFEHFIEETK